MQLSLYTWLYKWFVEHPRSVNETYLQHFGMACRFGIRLMVAGVRCLLHAFVPRWCEHTASESVHKLFDEMVENRVRREPVVADSAETA